MEYISNDMNVVIEYNSNKKDINGGNSTDPNRLSRLKAYESYSQKMEDKNNG